MATRNRIVRLDYVKAADLRPNPRNWREHPKAQREALQAILAEVGYADASLARELPDGSLELVDGHLRRDLTPEETVPVLVVDLDDDEAAKVLATHDPLAAMATGNREKLEALLKACQWTSDGGERLAADIAKREGLKVGGEIVEDEVPEPPAKPITKPGDLWLLGEHRLLCGDSTKVEDVGRVMGGERSGLMNTDPPYGVAYANDERPNPGVAKPRVAKPRVAKDELSDEQLQAFLESAFRVATQEALLETAAWYMWHADLTQGYFAAAAAAAANVVLHRQIIWVKPVLLLGRGQYHWKHEPCFMGWVRGKQPPDYGEGNGERTQTTVWELASVTQQERKELNHSTPKPVQLFAIPIVKHLQRGEICYEPFAGSGPQFIAAEQLNRRCYGLEISPQYCDVIIKRWENLTGKKAKLESAEKRKKKTNARTTTKTNGAQGVRGKPRKEAAKRVRAKSKAS